MIILDAYIYKDFDITKSRDWESQFGVKIIYESRLMKGLEFDLATGVETTLNMKQRQKVRHDVWEYAFNWKKKGKRFDVIGYQIVEMLLEDGTVVEHVMVKVLVDEDWVDAPLGDVI